MRKSLTLFLIVLAIVTLVMALNPILWQLLRINFFYWLTLALTFSLAGFLLRELIWRQRLPQPWFWFLFFNLVGVYYSYFGQPNVLNLFWEVVFTLASGKNYMPIGLGSLFDLLWGLVAWAGLSLIGFYVQNLYLKGPAHLAKFMLTSTIYLFYLNLAVQVIQPYFGRQ